MFNLAYKKETSASCWFSEKVVISCASSHLTSDDKRDHDIN